MPAASAMTVTGIPETIRSIRGLMRAHVQTRLGEEFSSAFAPVLTLARQNLVSNNSMLTGALHVSLVASVKVRPNKEMIFVIVGPEKVARTRIRGYTYSPGSSGKWQKVAVMGAAPASGLSYGDSRPSKYAHLVEFGARPHRYNMRTRKGIETFPHPGAQAKPFLGPAFAALSDSILANIGAATGRIVEEQAAQAAKSNSRLAFETAQSMQAMHKPS